MAHPDVQMAAPSIQRGPFNPGPANPGRGSAPSCAWLQYAAQYEQRFKKWPLL